ncbi:LptA/OstA family protein [Calothrix rhizosoleniae]|uniref:LptA/OstA family protein n=1 Tax=Calothrix rhizosoleniae TaxID=888997 RepID=UPI000B49E788|nr:LptA/OstA family protein [Calothrix rhizosoleniae]
MISADKVPQLPVNPWGLALMLPVVLLGIMSIDNPLRPNTLSLQTATAQTSGTNSPLTIRADVQEYDAKSQVVIARGNVQMSYPARKIQATAAQAQYFSKDRRIVLSGNVYILQNGGNSIRGETVTYLIDEGRFVALPKADRQVESIYIVNDTQINNQNNAPAPKTPPLKGKE